MEDRDLAGAATWSAAANGIWLAGGVLAYYTAASLALVTAIASAAAVVGILEARGSLDGRARVWADRALSYAAGTWATTAMLVVIPYVATDDGLSLWASRGFAGTATLAASVGMLAWSVAAVHAVGRPSDRAAVRSFALFHVATAVAAAYLLWAGDGTTTMLALRGQEIAAVDLRAAPAVAAVPGLLWGIVFLRARTATGADA